MKTLIKTIAGAVLLLCGMAAQAGLITIEYNAGNSCDGAYSTDDENQCSIAVLKPVYGPNGRLQRFTWADGAEGISDIIGKNDGGGKESNFNGYDVWGDMTYEACTDGTFTDCSAVLDPTGNPHGTWTYSPGDGVASPIRFWVNKTGNGFFLNFYSNSIDGASHASCASGLWNAEPNGNNADCLNSAISTFSGTWSSRTALSHLGLYNGETTTVPAPATLALLGLGLIGMAAARRRRVA